MKIGLATGCYDILHIGHIHFLKTAKLHCDYLIIGINDDKIVRQQKGQDRPVFSAKRRKEMLLALKYVDDVFIFDTWLIEPVIKKYKPDIFFIPEIDPGEKVKTEVAAKYGATLIKIPMHKSHGSLSTSAIIKKFKKSSYER